MEISRRTDYGIRVILDLAAISEFRRASSHEIAARQNIPSPFLAKIISQLSLAGLVTTHRGAGGGVALSRPASEISLLEVIEALEGPIRLNRCTIQPEACPENGHCPVHHIWVQAQAELAHLLSQTTFGQLVEPPQPGGSVPLKSGKSTQRNLDMPNANEASRNSGRRSAALPG
jgi:Rrf2 family protein